jgi:hypothetical protein
MSKPKQEAPQSSVSEDEQSPYIISRGTTKMVIETDLSAEELAVIDARIHAVMDMESQVEFHLDMFKKQLGLRLKKLIARRLALHGIWKRGKGKEVVEVEVVQDDRTHEVRRVRVDTGETITKRTLDQREQLEMFQTTSGPAYLPELDDTVAKQYAAEQQNEREELDKLLADIDWNQIQASIAEQLGLTVEELAASAGDHSAKGGKKDKKDGKSKSKKRSKSSKSQAEESDTNTDEGGEDGDEE